MKFATNRFSVSSQSITFYSDANGPNKRAKNGSTRDGYRGVLGKMPLALVNLEDIVMFSESVDKLFTIYDKF